ncbi:MAG: hypothetical protein ACOX1S_05330 [Anaerostipes sp.]|jgi:hypothetical protein
MAYTKVFSEFEVKKIGIKFEGETAFESADCVGSMEDTATVKTVSKKCRGVETKTRSRGTGAGEIALSIHMPYDMYVKMFGMEDDSLKDGVVAYGEDSLHPVFSITELVEDEDGNEKLKAYPNCTMKEAPKVSVKNGDEEVAEIECTISYSPDHYGKGMYEVVTADAKDQDMISKWMDAFTTELVRITSA